MASADIKESQISPKGKRKTTGKSTAEMSRKQTTDSGDAAGGTEAVEFNLSDPEQLARQLDRVDLTEEESDELLREAYKINKHLKMMLQQKQDKMAASMRTHSASSSSSSRRGGSILPPISNRSGGAPQRTVKAYANSSSSSSKTAGGASAASKAKTSKTPRSPNHKPQPQWDDRFSYS